ncbi:MAG: hypothetical protein ACI934_001857, partial [Pseudohongiellaceae bacterium]
MANGKSSMKTLIKAILVVSLLTTSFFGSISLQAQSGDPIGRVLTSTGSVEAESSDGQIRTLSRGAQVFEEDSVITGPNGFAQLRMVDSAIISLREDTTYAFHEYAFDDNPNTGDSAVMELVRGGFRTISGSISDGDNDTYRVETAFANIGVRGTTHEGVISFGVLFTGVTDGGTTVSNGFGSVDTGLGANFDYTQTTQGRPPQGLLRRPGQLGQVNLNAGAGLTGDDGDDGDEAGDGDGDGNAGAAAGGDGDDQTGGDNNDDNAPDFNGLGAPATNNGGDNNQGTGTATPPVTPPPPTTSPGGTGDGGGNVGTTPT